VVSSSLTTTTWRNSTVLGRYDPVVIQGLKDRLGGALYVSGSATLVHALLADGLVDELHLFLYPLTRGNGPRLFADGAPDTTWSLTKSDPYDNGVVYLRYERSGATS
jgi:dihydrofolate reductase